MRQPPEGWAESTEGDLDPDLTEEAGYSGWDLEQPGRDWWPLLTKAVAALVLTAIVGGILLQLR